MLLEMKNKQVQVRLTDSGIRRRRSYATTPEACCVFLFVLPSKSPRCDANGEETRKRVPVEKDD